VFRSLWLVGIGAIPSGASLLIVLGILGLTGATLSAAATASAAMLFGLGIDGVVLLYVGHSLSLAEGLTPDAAVDRLAGPSSSMLLGMWTTAATFYGLALVDFPSLEQLGILIGHSMVLCGILTLIMVPAFLPRRRPARPIRALRMPRLAASVERRSTSILIGAVVATLVLGACATRLRINPTLDRLRSVTPGARLLEQLSPAFGLPREVHVVMSAGTDLNTMLAANERFIARLAAELPGLAVQAPSTLLPAEETQTARASIIRARELSPAAVGDALVQSGQLEGFRQDSFDPFLRRLPAMLDPVRRLTYDGYV
jgi:predicted RND superfamily exporter protein